MTSKRDLEAEVAHLRECTTRMANQIRGEEWWRLSLEAALEDLELARDECRRLRGLLDGVGAADRAMPQPPEVAA